MVRRLLWLAGASVLVAAIITTVFLIRAGDPWSGNWPIDFELRTSDNGVLFQFAQDVFTGRPLDWSFSPQVYVFPEIPISLVAYVLAGGTVQVYYIVVAALNSVLLFLALFAVIRYLFAAQGFWQRLGRSFVAMFPILFLPLLGTTPLFEYPLAATYYYGMYLVILLVPVMFFARAPWVRIVVGAGLVLTAASNPLTLVFTVPALVCVAIVFAIAGGIRPLLRPASWTVAIVGVALAIRFTLFSHLQGTSPFSYVDKTVFAGRLVEITAYLATLSSGSVITESVLVIGSFLVLAGFAVAVVASVRMIRSRQSADLRVATLMYYALVPITGLVGTVVLLITDYLYLWPVLILPLVLILLPIPTRWVPRGVGLAAVILLVIGSVTGGVVNVANASSAYLHYRLPQTRCLDSKLPVGMTIGYATLSDARPMELTSTRGFRLIQLKSSGVRAYWLTNRDYAKDDVGRFFVIDHHSGEPALSVSYLDRHFGAADSSFTCYPGLKVLVYTSPSKLAMIKARYSTLPAP